MNAEMKQGLESEESREKGEQNFIQHLVQELCVIVCGIIKPDAFRNKAQFHVTKVSRVRNLL